MLVAIDPLVTVPAEEEEVLEWLLVLEAAEVATMYQLSCSVRFVFGVLFSTYTLRHRRSGRCS